MRIKRGVFEVFTLVFLVSLLFFSVPTLADCCIASPNANEFCQDLDPLNAPDCTSWQTSSCEFTVCSDVGCCDLGDSCQENSERSECFGGSFHPFQSCEQVTTCNSGCCVIDIGGNPTPNSFTGRPIDCAGDYYPVQCSEVPIFGAEKGNITGTVTDLSGNPLENVEITIGNKVFYSTSTGSFSQPYLSVGTYTPSVLLSGYTLVSQSPNPLEIISDTETTLTFVMDVDSSPLLSLSGIVRDSLTNAPLSGAQVLFDNTLIATSDVSGRYTLSGSYVYGVYELSASKVGYETRSRSYDFNTSTSLSGIDFVLDPLNAGYVCGNDVREGTEECDTNDDTACPGRCQSTCECPATCEEKGFHCADRAYQCNTVGGVIRSEYDLDCYSIENDDLGVCCDTEPSVIPNCVAGESSGGSMVGTTDVSASGGDLCYCGSVLASTTTDARKFCCVQGSTRGLQYTPCSPPGQLSGVVTDADSGALLSEVSVVLDGLYYDLSTDNSEKNYEILEVASGDYTLVANKPGYEPYTQEITLAAGVATLLNFSLQPQDGFDVILGVDILAVQGVKAFDLDISVSDNQRIYRYEIRRSDNYLADSYIGEIISPDFSETFRDSSIQWFTEYTYSVSAYTEEGFLVAQENVTTISGDSACEGLIESKEFCGTELCFSSKSQDDCFGSKTVEGAIYRFTCNAQNKLSYATGSASSSVCEDGSCVENNGLTICSDAIESFCEGLGLPSTGLISSSRFITPNVFGLYYFNNFAYIESIQQCESSVGLLDEGFDGFKYCYYDSFTYPVAYEALGRPLPFAESPSSVTSVDQCLSCNPIGFCQDYQSEGTCVRDNCQYGDTYGTTCAWKDTNEELGKGFCYAVESTSTQYCSLCNVNNPTFYNSRCTEEICGLLGSCIPGDGERSCGACLPTSVCGEFNGNQDACEGSGPSAGGYAFIGLRGEQSDGTLCQSSTEIDRGGDICGIGFCRYVNDRCIKDANVDGESDCDGTLGDTSCETDRTIPETLFFSEPILSSFSQQLFFSVSGSVNTKSYYCIAEKGQYCCPEHEFDSIVSPLEQYPDLNNSESEKTLWYFSVSEHGNPEEIQAVNITVDTKTPVIDISYRLEDSQTSNVLSDLYITLNSHEGVYECTHFLDGVFLDEILVRSLASFPANTPQVLPFASLPDDEYIYSLYCEDSYGNYHSSDHQIVVDRVKVIEGVTPHYLTTTDGEVSLEFSTADNEYYCEYQQLEPGSSTITEFSTVRTGNQITYTSESLSLSAANTYHYGISCYEDSTRQIVIDRASSRITLDTIAPESQLYVAIDGVFEIPQNNERYAHPLFMINCTDESQGPPREFRCNSIRYCYSYGSACTLSDSSPTVQTDSVQFTLSSIQSGDYYICYESFDAGGNKENRGSGTCDVVEIDLSNPTLTITQPAPNLVLGEPSVTLRGEWRDNVIPETISIKVVNQESSPPLQRIISDVDILGSAPQGTFESTLQLSGSFSGLNILLVEVIDGSGNRQSASTSFFLDYSPPGYYNSYVEGISPFSSSSSPLTLYNSTPVSVLQNSASIASFSSSVDIEYGSTLVLTLFANDDEYSDLFGRYGEDVSISYTITPDHSQPSLSAEALSGTIDSYNASTGAYSLELYSLYPVDNYSLSYTLIDGFGNSEQASDSFSVIDTLPPFFTYDIRTSSGQTLSNADFDTLSYGNYTIVLTASEPLESAPTLSFSLRGNHISIPFTLVGDSYEGPLEISPLNPLYLDLALEDIYFSLSAADTNGNILSYISQQPIITLSTIGPEEPFLFSPNLNQGLTRYVNSPTYPLKGLLKDFYAQPLENAEIQVLKSTLDSDFLPRGHSSFVTDSTLTTTRSLLQEEWNPAEYGDTLVYVNQNSFIVHNYNEQLLSGRYFEFLNNPLPNRELHKITSVQDAGVIDGKRMVEVQFETELSEFPGLVPNDLFSDTLLIYDTATPPGYFLSELSLSEGANHFYLRPFMDGVEGKSSELFTFIYDSTPPELTYFSPEQGSVIGNREIALVAQISSTTEEISSYSLTLNGVQVPLILSTIDQQTLELTGYTGLLEGPQNVVLVVEDFAGNILRETIEFTVDFSVPSDPLITPAGTITEKTPELTFQFYEEVVISKADLIGPVQTLDLLSALQQEGNTYTYEVPLSAALVDGIYSIEILAQKPNSPEEIGYYFHTFTVDSVAPNLIIDQTLFESDFLPVIATLQTDEPARCYYGFERTAAQDLPEVFPYDSSNDFRFAHVHYFYSLDDFEQEFFVSCEDVAGNRNTQVESFRLSVNSLLLPQVGVYLPEENRIVTTASEHTIIGSTFDVPVPSLWSPSVPVTLHTSTYLYDSYATFDTQYPFISSPKDTIVLAQPHTFQVEGGSRSLLLSDELEEFNAQQYLSFAETLDPYFRYYDIVSVQRIGDQLSPSLSRVTLNRELPQAMPLSQELSLSNASSPGGWFSYSLLLEEGAQRFYLTAQNTFGNGYPTSVYTIVKDTKEPVFDEFFPRQNEIIAESLGTISVVADGTGSEIDTTKITIDQLSVKGTITPIGDHLSTITYNSPINDGLHTITVRALDEAGNEVDESVTFEINGNVPKRPTLLPSLPTSDERSSLTLLFDEQVSLTNVYLSGPAHSATELTQDFTTEFNEQFVYVPAEVYEEGEYQLEVRAKRLGQFDEGRWFLDFSVDYTAPVVIDSPGSITTSHLPVQFLFTTNEPATCRYADSDLLYDQMFQTIDTTPVRYHLTNAYLATTRGYLYIRCMDEAGNVMTSSHIVGINTQGSSAPRCGDGIVTYPEQCDGDYFGEISSCSQISPDFSAGVLSCDPLTCEIDTTTCTHCATDLDCVEGTVCVESTCQPIIPDCYSNNDCGLGEACLSGSCIGLVGYCEVTADCPENEVCDTAINQCIPHVGECSPENTCDVGYVCVDSYCVEEYECTSQDDCQAFEACLAGECVYTGEIPDSCPEEGECQEGTLCVVGNCHPNDTIDFCLGNSDCQDGESCLDGICLPANQECTSDDECGFDEICHLGTCTRLYQHCLSDTECGEGYVCLDTYCVPEGYACFNDGDCEFDEYCHNGACVSALAYCGNNRVEPGETCDGTDFGSLESCSDLQGFSEGVISCLDTCDIDTSACVAASTCGDGVLSYDEECEPSLPLTYSCSDFGHAGGEVSCLDTCDIDTSACAPAAVCGDGIISPGEECEEGLPLDLSCSELGSFVEGTLSCNNCLFDTSLCTTGDPVCGNGIIELGETCEPGITVNQSCSDLGLSGGSPTCDSSCHLDTSFCSPSAAVCGDGIISPGEECELGSFFACTDFSFGTENDSVTCSQDCTLDFDTCVPQNDSIEPTCGDGIISYFEDCEVYENGTTTFNNVTCESLGFSGGTLSCGTCQLDVSSCTLPTTFECGNGITEPGEECDGSLSGLSCELVSGFESGSLSCDDSCLLDTSMCVFTGAVCGNGIVEPGEQCEVGVSDPLTCSTIGSFTDGTAPCSSSCVYDTSFCSLSYECGNGVIEPGEECDGLALPFDSCTDYAPYLTNGLLQCGSTCEINATLCVPLKSCGNGIVDSGEHCDGNIGSAVCQDFDSFLYGTLTCDSACRYDTNSCFTDQRVCGNGIVEPGEQCDPRISPDISCSSFDSYTTGDISCNSQCRYDTKECLKDFSAEPTCGNDIIDLSLGEQCDGELVPSSCSDLGFLTEGSPRCYSTGTPNECQYDVSPCGASAQCSGTQTVPCSQLSPLYIFGDAVCENSFYSMDTCYNRDSPELSLSVEPLVSSDTITLSGTVAKTKELEVYVNGVLVKTLSFDTSLEQPFSISDILLPESTLTGDGVNSIRVVAYGAEDSILSEIEYFVTRDVLGPEIVLTSPENGIVSTTQPRLEFSTTKESTCAITYENSVSLVTQPLLSSTGYTHSITIETPLVENAQTAYTLSCIDLIGNNVTLQGMLRVDTISPVILDFIIGQEHQVTYEGPQYREILVFDPFNSSFTALADSNSTCRYGINKDEYDDMVPFSALTADTFATQFTTTESIAVPDSSFRVSSLCLDEAGLLSTPYTYFVQVTEAGVPTITPMSGSYTNKEAPTLLFRTPIPANCTASYGLQVTPLSPSQVNNSFMHSFRVDDLGLLLEDGQTYTFDLSCQSTRESASLSYELTADFTAPSVAILNPLPNEFVTSDLVDVTISTETDVTLEIFVNDFFVDDVLTTGPTAVIPVILMDNVSTLLVRATDQAGNVNSVSQLVFYTEEPESPIVVSTFPEREATVNSISIASADVRTAFGIDLDLGQTIFVVYNSETEESYPGELSFVPGTSENGFVGKLTFNMSVSLGNGNYELRIKPVDILGSEGLLSTHSFTVDEALPVFILTSPVNSRSNEEAQPEFRTSDQQFTFSGRVESRSPLTSVTYSVKKNTQFSDPVALTPGGFSKTITLDTLRMGDTQKYIIKLYAKNTEGRESEYFVSIIYDLEPPLPEEIIIE